MGCTLCFPETEGCLVVSKCESTFLFRIKIRVDSVGFLQARDGWHLITICIRIVLNFLSQGSTGILSQGHNMAYMYIYIYFTHLHTHHKNPAWDSASSGAMISMILRSGSTCLGPPNVLPNFFLFHLLLLGTWGFHQRNGICGWFSQESLQWVQGFPNHGLPLSRVFWRATSWGWALTWRKNSNEEN